MNKKTAKRALRSSILSLLLCVSMLVGTTFAWFTDSVTSGSNIIKSGNLDIVLEYWDGDSWEDAEGRVIPFVAADGRDQSQILWEPGCTYKMAPIRVRNVGNLTAKILILINGITGDEKLMEAIELKTGINNIPQTVLDGSAGNQLQRFEDAEVDIMYGMPEGNIIFDWSLAGKGIVTPGTGHTDTSPEFTISGHMAEEAGNEYQGLSIEGISITVIAAQQTYESDSFNNQYDKNAEYPAVSSAYKGENEPITLRSGNVEVDVPAEAPAGNYTIEVDNRNKATDDAGNTTLTMDINLLKDGVKVQQTQGIEYPVRVGVGKGLVVIGVDHNGEAVKNYNYNPGADKVAFETDSFSPFAVTYFDEVTKIGSAEELIAALDAIKKSAKEQIPGENGNKQYRENAILVLKEDIVIDNGDRFMYDNSNGAPLHFYGVKGILDLNGHSIRVTSNALLDGKTHANAVLLFQYSDVDIVGEGSIIAENKSIPVYAWANCTVDIYGGNYVTNASGRNESAVYVNNASALVNVYGGTYTDSAYAFNVHDNCGTTPVMVLHKGITYADFLKNGTTDVTASDINNGRIIVAEGCELYEYEENGVGMNKVVAN